MKLRAVGAELFDVDGKTDTTKLMVAFRSFAKAHKIGKVINFYSMKAYTGSRSITPFILYQGPIESDELEMRYRIFNHLFHDTKKRRKIILCGNPWHTQLYCQTVSRNSIGHIDDSHSSLFLSESTCIAITITIELGCHKC